MSQSLYKILELDNEITDGLLNNKSIDDLDIQKSIMKIKSYLKKIDNREVLYLLKNGNSINEVLDVTEYLNKYKINKKELKENNYYKEELNKLNIFIELISDSSINEEEYMYICNKCGVDEIANYLLSKMTNRDIMELSNESDDWNYKLFLYGNLKK